jgi:mannose-6-phosphate isomerase-like protein (cupin superfamily)
LEHAREVALIVEARICRDVRDRCFRPTQQLGGGPFHAKPSYELARRRAVRRKHDREDECFIVLEGELSVDIEGQQTVVLGKYLGYTVPRGVVHRTRASVKTVILMVEAASVVPTGDQG